MAKRKKKSKAKETSIRLKTSFAIQSSLEELDNLKKALELIPEISGSNPFIDLLEETVIESLDIIFPKPFEA